MLGRTYYQMQDFNKAAEVFEDTLKDERMIQ